MKKSTAIYFIFCIFVTAFSSCKNEKHETSSGEVAKFSLARIDSVSKSTNQHISYPIFTGENSNMLNNAVIELISNDSLTLDVHSVRQAFNTTNIFRQYESDLADLEDKTFLESLGYSQYDSISVIKNTPKIIVLRNFCETYTGGAHGGEYIAFKNVNPATGKAYNIDDFFKPNYKTALTKMGEKYFREQFLPEIEMKPNTPLTEENGFWFDSNKTNEGIDNIFYLSESFGINEKGFNFVYGNYEIGPYAIGLPEFTIPFSELKQLLKDEWATEFVK